jgi:hypothetical protein
MGLFKLCYFDTPIDRFKDFNLSPPSSSTLIEVNLQMISVEDHSFHLVSLMDRAGVPNVLYTHCILI